MTRWFVAKYIPDLRRREPMNIGVVLFCDGKRFARFLGESEADMIDGRHARWWASSLSNYRAWVHRWRYDIAKSKTAEDFAGSNRILADSSYYLEPGGELLSSDPIEPVSFLDRLFADLVEDPKPKKRRPNVGSRDEDDWLWCAFLEIGIAGSVEPDVEVPIDQDTLIFDYRHTNGIQRLFKQVALASNQKKSWRTVHEAAWSLAGIKALDKVRGFAVVDPTGSLNAKDQMGVLSKQAEVIDIHSDGAVRELEAVLQLRTAG
jgi:hypothetical protein